MLLPAELAGAVGLLARGADGDLLAVGLLEEVVLDLEGLPLDHPDGVGLVEVLALLVEAGLVDGHAYVVDGPWLGGVAVPLPAGLAGLVVLLALAADGQPLVGELDLDGLGETRRGEGQDVAMGRGLGVEQLLRARVRKWRENYSYGRRRRITINPFCRTNVAWTGR